MTISTFGSSTPVHAQKAAAIEALDLEPIKFKATRKEDGYGWSAAYADRVAVSYKRYLTLCAKYPERTIAPDQDTDRFWHMHILDTRKYAADCQQIFGYFLHHFPYLGLRGADDAKALDDAFAQTQALSLAEFGQPLHGAHAAWCAADKPTQNAAWCAADGAAQSAAWCAADAKSANAAWCAAEGAAQNAAWCAAETMPVSAAWCAADGAAQKAAWCAAEAKSLNAAWCAAEGAAQSAAWCAAEAKPAAAWCAAEALPVGAAWCAAEAVPQKAAWCAADATTEAPVKAAWCAAEGTAPQASA